MSGIGINRTGVTLRKGRGGQEALRALVLLRGLVERRDRRSAQLQEGGRTHLGAAVEPRGLAENGLVPVVLLAVGVVVREERWEQRKKAVKLC